MQDDGRIKPNSNKCSSSAFTTFSRSGARCHGHAQNWTATMWNVTLCFSSLCVKEGRKTSGNSSRGAFYGVSTSPCGIIVLRDKAAERTPLTVKLVETPSRSSLRRSTIRLKCRRKSASTIGWRTSAMRKTQRNVRRRPMPRVKEFCPQVLVIDPFTTCDRETTANVDGRITWEGPRRSQHQCRRHNRSLCDNQ